MLLFNINFGKGGCAMSTWSLTALMANPFSGRELELEHFFPEDEEFERRNSDPLKNRYIPVDQLPDENNHSMMEVERMEELRAVDFEEKKDCDEYDDPKPISDFLPPDETEVEMWEEMEKAMPWPSHSSQQIESMSAIRQFGYHGSLFTNHFSNRKVLKDDRRINRPKKSKYHYDEETDEYTFWETRYTPDRGRNHRVRGQINPPRRRVERDQKLKFLFDYERQMEEYDKWREHLRHQ